MVCVSRKLTYSSFNRILSSVLRDTKFTADPSKYFMNRLCLAGVTNPPSCPPGPAPSKTKRAFATCSFVASSFSNCFSSFFSSSSSLLNNSKVELTCITLPLMFLILASTFEALSSSDVILSSSNSSSSSSSPPSALIIFGIFFFANKMEKFEKKKKKSEMETWKTALL